MKEAKTLERISLTRNDWQIHPAPVVTKPITKLQGGDEERLEK
jgi:hypothetical protein